MTVGAGKERRACRCLRADAPGVGRAEFPACSSSVGRVRAFVRRVLAGFPALDEVELCASELATNAVRYGSERGDVFGVLVRRRRGVVYVAVTDSGGSSVPRLVDAEQDDERFRGLALVDGCALAWGAVPERDGGYRVWFEVAS